MQIRAMTISDYPQVHALWQAAPGVGLNDVDDSRDGIAKYLARNPGTCFVAEADGKIIGVVLGGHDGRRGSICHLAVAASNQRQGVGAALVSSAVDALRAEGIRKIWLVVMGDNARAAAFWEKQGFAVRTDIDYRDRIIIEENHAKNSCC